ncbi:MAG TPA: type IV secretory system conjugative DNA transfer family protein, partial [Acidimicrobiales bacterium]|nr:type IV secretory system conjugative DNA transfer family protein [Acidimicrobiales bacterium]
MAHTSVVTVMGLAALVAAALFGHDNPFHRAPRPSSRPIDGIATRNRTTGSARWPTGPILWKRREMRSPARWARASDLRPLRHRPPTPGRLVLGRSGRTTLAAEPAQSVVVFGPTQSRKTTGFAIPAILGWQGPVVATSVKTDLVRHTMGWRQRCGPVQCFDPSSSTGLPSAQWSPLNAARTWSGARKVATSLTEGAKGGNGPITDGDFWYATAAKLLAPLLFAAATGGGAMTDVVRWVDTQEESEVLDLLDAAGVVEASQAAQASFAKEDRQRSSVYTTAETVLEPFADPPADWAGEVPSSIDPRCLIGEGGTLYLCAPAHDQRRLRPLFTAVVRQIVEHAYETVTRTGRPLDPP